MAVMLAFCCLGFAAANDFVFKLFARKERSRGAFVFAVGHLHPAQKDHGQGDVSISFQHFLVNFKPVSSIQLQIPHAL